MHHLDRPIGGITAIQTEEGRYLFDISFQTIISDNTEIKITACEAGAFTGRDVVVYYAIGCPESTTYRQRLPATRHDAR